MSQIIVWGWDAGGVCGRLNTRHLAERNDVRLEIHDYERNAPEHMVKIELFDGDTLLRRDTVSSLLIRFKPELVFADAKEPVAAQTSTIEPMKHALAD